MDGTHASLPPGPNEIAWLQELATEARTGRTQVVASHTLQTYVEELPPDERFASTIRVLRMATGFPLLAAGPVESPRVTRAGNLWLYSYASGKYDPIAQVDQHEWALPALAAAHTAPTLTGQGRWRRAGPCAARGRGDVG